MEDFKEYTMSGGTVGPVDEAQLDALVGRYEWFTPARILRVLQTGRSDRRVSIAAVSRLLPLGRFTVDREALCALSPADLIDRFLKEGGHRIVAEEGEVVEEVRTEAELSGDDDLVTEDLAEIYLAQGLYDEAIAIYRKLSLLNPEKSVYFASLIDKIANK